MTERSIKFKELQEVIGSNNPENYCISLIVYEEDKCIKFFRCKGEPLIVTFDFLKSNNIPDNYEDIDIIDFGNTITIGKYEIDFTWLLDKHGLYKDKLIKK